MCNVKAECSEENIKGELLLSYTMIVHKEPIAGGTSNSFLLLKRRVELESRAVDVRFFAVNLKSRTRDFPLHTRISLRVDK